MFLAERFHWTLDYIDGLSWEDLLSVYAVLDGKGKAEADMQKHGR